MGVLEKFSLSGRSALVTGATGHLGSAMAWALAEAGGHILINSRSPERCQSLAAAICNAGYSAESAAFDIRDETQVREFFVGKGDQSLHCLINNAYAGGAGTIETAQDEFYRQSFEMTVVAAHNLLRHALPALRRAVRASGDASVMNVASMYGVVSPDFAIYDTAASTNPPFYGAAKAALLQWTRYAACEFGAEGIRVNSISPGPFPSDHIQKTDPAFIERLEGKVPMGRIGAAHEIQGAVLLLASPASTFINGANLSVDGGWTSW